MAASDLTILSAKLNLQIFHVAFGQKLLREFRPLIGINPKANFKWGPADDLCVAPASLNFERLVKVNVATIARVEYCD